MTPPCADPLVLLDSVSVKDCSVGSLDVPQMVLDRLIDTTHRGLGVRRETKGHSW